MEYLIIIKIDGTDGISGTLNPTRMEISDERNVIE